MFRMTNTLAGGLAALLISVGPGTLLANSPVTGGGERSITVHFGDLDLSRPTDVAKLYRRIQIAAGHVCGPHEMGGPHIASRVYYRCVTDAIDRTISTLDRDALSAYHQAHGTPSMRDQTIARR